MKKFLLLLLFPLALFSCGRMKIYGHYAFQMGGDKSTHFGVFLDLVKEQVKDEETGEVLGEKFDFGMKLSKDAEPKKPDPDDPNYLEKFFAYEFVQIMNIEDNPDAGLRGYFNVDDKYIEDIGKRLFLTIQVEDIELDIPREILEILLVAYVDGKQIQLILPVSFVDFQFQLCWYGLFIDIYKCTVKYKDGTQGPFYDLETAYLFSEDSPYKDKLPGPKNVKDRIGTHPTEQNVIDMNNICEDLFNMQKEDYLHPLYIILKEELGIEEIVDEPETLGYHFSDFYTLAVDLLKS